MKTDCSSGLRGNGSDLSELDIQLEAIFRKPYSVLVRFTFIRGALLSCFPDIVAVSTQKKLTSLELFLLIVSSDTYIYNKLSVRIHHVAEK